MSQPDIETKLREALDGVTPGPWKVGAAGDICHGSGDWNGLKLYSGWVEGAWLGDIEAESNARLIALCSPDNIGALLDTIATLRKQVSDTAGALNEIARNLWYDATNAVCQSMQDADLCKCADGQCIAASVEPTPEDIGAFRAALASLKGEADASHGQITQREDGGKEAGPNLNDFIATALAAQEQGR